MCTGGNVLLQLLLQEAVDQLLARLHVVLELSLMLVQDRPVLGGLVLYGRQRPLHLLLPTGQLLLGSSELFSAASLDVLEKRRRIKVFSSIKPENLQRDMQLKRQTEVSFTWWRVWTSVEIVPITERFSWAWLSACSLTLELQWRSRSTRPAATNPR